MMGGARTKQFQVRPHVCTASLTTAPADGSKLSPLPLVVTRWSPRPPSHTGCNKAVAVPSQPLCAIALTPSSSIGPPPYAPHQAPLKRGFPMTTPAKATMGSFPTKYWSMDAVLWGRGLRKWEGM